MADIIPPGYAEATILHQHAGMARAAAVVHGINRQQLPTATADELAALVADAYLQTMRTRIDSQVTIGPVTLTVATAGEPVIGFAPATAPGGRGQASVTPAISLLVQKRTARGGRRGRGRSYIPWALPENQVDEVGLISPGERDGWAATASGWLAELEGNDVPMALLHSVGLTDPGGPNAVTSLVVSPVVATQRRRQVR